MNYIKSRLFVQCLDKTRHIYSQNSKYGYLNLTNMIVMVTAKLVKERMCSKYGGKKH